MNFRVGDYFAVPVGDGRFGLGQVVGRYKKAAWFLVVFDQICDFLPTQQTAEEAAKSGLRFLGLSLDAKLHNGDWPIVGNGVVSGDVSLPAYREDVGSPGHVDVVDFSGERRRPATPAEVAVLSPRAVVAPVRLEKALKADLGLEDWSTTFDELRPGALAKTRFFFS